MNPDTPHPGSGRRDFLMTTAGLVSAGFMGLARHARAGISSPSPAAGSPLQSYGPPTPDPHGTIDLPEGFHYRVFSTWGQPMDDGLLVPAKHDGMACFPVDDTRCLLIRNHEINTAMPIRYGAFGWQNERLGRVDPRSIYDYGTPTGRPGAGGTTTVLYDLRAQQPINQWLSLAGTGHNCSGGATPWGSWLSCEEWTQRADAQHAQDHGYVFEVPATTTAQLAEPRPIRAMGRFVHEAVACAPAGDVLYLTEDRGDGCLYRYLPRVHGKLHEGGRLQALVVDEASSMDTRNWTADGTANVIPGIRLKTSWIDLEDVEAPNDDLRYRAFNAGAARFARGEGIWHAGDQVHFACTTGGQAQIGQIFTYRPSPHEGTAREAEAPATLELFIEPNDSTLIEMADNLTVSPNGELFICEDGPDANGMTRVTPEGGIERFAMNRANTSELAGPCFSPDGSTLFVNIQNPGATLAITGPWRHG